jgi:hypothetical protein
MTRRRQFTAEFKAQVVLEVPKLALPGLACWP